MEQQIPLPKITKPPKILKIALFIILVIVVVLALLLAGSSLNLNCSFGILSGRGGSYEDGWKAASQKLEASGLLRPESEEVFVITGTITSITAGRISLKANPTVLNPLAEQAPETRTVTVNSETKVFKLIPKNPEELNRESEAFREETEKLAPGAVPPTPPSPYKEEEIKITDLKTGDIISATSETNIKMSVEFIAKEISLTLVPETPPPPTP